jgi:hypothetical protein
MLNKFHKIKYYFIPGVVNLIAICILYFTIEYEVVAVLFTMGLIAFNAFIVPIYLVVCNICIKNIPLIKKVFFSVLSICINIASFFCSWLIVREQLFSPHPSSDHVVALAVPFVFAVVLGGLLIQCIVKTIAKSLQHGCSKQIE